jgi:hypothetical protein
MGNRLGPRQAANQLYSRATRDMARKDLLLLVGGWALLGCGKPAPAPSTDATAHLGGGVVATVGAITINDDAVTRVASARGLSPRDALEALIRDALLASAFLAEHRSADAVAAARRSSGARAMLEDLRREALARGAPTDDEVAQFTKKQWIDLDRPEAVATQHAVVLVQSPDQEATALSVAREIRRAVVAAGSSVDFEAEARRVASRGLRVVVETLPAVALDGRVMNLDDLANGPASLEVAYAQAAHALTVPGALSEPVRSSYGYHVIRLNARVAAVRVPLERRRQLLSEVVYAERARLANRALIESAREQTEPTVDRSFAKLTEHLVSEP